MSTKKGSSTKSKPDQVWLDQRWTVSFGKLKPGPGRPRKVSHLFRVIGEKLPIEALDSVASHLKSKGLHSQGVYVAHDSMGYVRYAGRGRIFDRLRGRARANELEIRYFSFYVVRDKAHEREIETLLIRTASPMLYFNERKKRLDLSSGNIHDYEPGTQFYERHYKKGRKPVKRRRRPKPGRA